MPQPIRKSIQLTFNPSAVANRPALCARIVIIGSYWSAIEDTLTRIFAHVTGIDPAVAAALLAAVPSLITRLQITETALDVLISSEVARKFKEELCPDIRKRANERNMLMHAHWRAHDDYPDSIILTRQTGNPEGKMDLYVLKDFAEIEGRMDQLMRAVQQFEMFVEGGWFPKDEERRKYFWRLHTHIGDPEKLIDHQAQKSDPSKSPK